MLASQSAPWTAMLAPGLYGLMEKPMIGREGEIIARRRKEKRAVGSTDLETF